MRETDSERSASASDAHAQGSSPGAGTPGTADAPGAPAAEEARHPADAPVLRRMEEDVRHPVTVAERAGYLGFVAHEMRNPLSTGLWSAELLGRLSVEDRGGARGEKLSGMCLRTLTRLRVLLEDYFLVERLGIGGLPIKREPVSIASVIEQSCNRIDGQFDVPPLPDVTVQADRSLLDRMIESVLAVAARDSTVKIDVGVHGGAVEIRVAGAPPAPNALEVPSKGTPSDSTGRALSVLVARTVAAAHSGEVRLERDAYVIVLPLTDPQPGAQP